MVLLCPWCCSVLGAALSMVLLCPWCCSVKTNHDNDSPCLTYCMHAIDKKKYFLHMFRWHCCSQLCACGVSVALLFLFVSVWCFCGNTVSVMCVLFFMCAVEPFFSSYINDTYFIRKVKVNRIFHTFLRDILSYTLH